MILFYIYSDLFKIKIYNAACSQIEYFDHLTNQNIDSKITQNFLRIGDEILQLRKIIIKLQGKIVALNPFCEDCEGNYLLYLGTILKNEEMAKTKKKKFDNLVSDKENEKMI